MKLVISDLDGTLLYSRSVITEHTVSTIKKLTEKGVEFAIATGRGKEGVIDVMKALNMKIYLICNNGASIYDKDRNCIYEKTIDKELAIEILKTIKENNVYYSAFYRENVYEDKDDIGFIKRPYFKKQILENIEDCPALNKIVIGEKEDKILEISKILKEKFAGKVEITVSSPECIDIVPKGCNKAEGVKKISEILKIDMKDIMAFGDGENDIDMLKEVGYPVVMENAKDEIKKQIKNRAPKNIEDGVAKYLEKYYNL